MHKNPTKQTLCVDLRCMENQQIFGLLTMNQPQLAWAFTNNVEKTNSRTSFCRGKKNSQSSSWPMFQSSLSLRTVLHKKMKLFLPSHGNLLPEIEQGKPKKVHKFQEFLFSLWGGCGTRRRFCVHRPLDPNLYVLCVVFSVCFCLCMTA